MGLLDKARQIRGGAETKPQAGAALLDSPRPDLASAARGLRARAQSLRGARPQETPSSPAGGVQIRGLRQRAERLRDAGEESPFAAEAQRPRRGLRQRLEEIAAGSPITPRAGLRARAEQLSKEAPPSRAAEPATSRVQPGADDLGPFAAAFGEEPAAYDPFDAALGPRDEEGIAAGDQDHAEPALDASSTGWSPEEEGVDLAFGDGQEIDFDLGADKGETERGELPDWSYDGASDASTDPARDSEFAPVAERSAEASGDPFEEWQREAEAEAEQQAHRQSQAQARPASRDQEFLFDSDDLSTAPAESYIASQRKVDHYLALFDITKEISTIDRFEDLWDSLNYAVMGQIGAETICIFSATQRTSNGAIFYPVAHTGFEMPQGWALKRGDEIYDRLSQEDGVKYVEEFLNQPRAALSPMERRILETSKARLVVPLKNMGRLYGIAFVGAALSGHDYTVDDIEFLSLLGEIAAVGADRVLSRLEFERDTEELRRRNMIHGSMFSLARRAANVRGLDELYDLLAERLREDFQVESFSLVLLNPKERAYRIFAGNRISPETIDRFHLGVNSELVAMISNLTRVYDLADFRTHPEITANYSNDDLALMQHYWITPLINMHWLVGFITIHRTAEAWTELNRELMVTAAEIISSAAANCIILSERESLFRDPFSPLEERLREELRKAREFNAPVTLVDFRIKNIRRLNDLLPAERVADYLGGLSRAISGLLFETDFLARVSQGRFALILPGRDRDEAEVFLRKLKAEVKRIRPLSGSPVDPQLVHSLVSFPRDAGESGKMLSIFE